jgi:hypothetical protein
LVLPTLGIISVMCTFGELDRPSVMWGISILHLSFWSLIGSRDILWFACGCALWSMSTSTRCPDTPHEDRDCTDRPKALFWSSSAFPVCDCIWIYR